MTGAPADGKLVHVLSLIGGPMDGRVVECPESARWLDVEGSRYVVRRAAPARSGSPEDVGIFLPLFAGAAARRGGRAAWRRQLP